MRSAASLPTQQLPPDAQRITSRRHAFLCTLLRGFAPFGRRSRPLRRLHQSGPTGPQTGRFPPTASPFPPKTLRLSIAQPRARVSTPLGDTLPLPAPANRRLQTSPGHRTGCDADRAPHVRRVGEANSWSGRSKVSVGQRACRFGAENSPPPCLGVEKTRLRTECQGMHPPAQAQPPTLGQVPPTRTPLSSQPDSIRRRDTRTKKTSHCVTATAANLTPPCFALLPAIPSIAPSLVGPERRVDCCEWIVVTATAWCRARS